MFKMSSIKPALIAGALAGFLTQGSLSYAQDLAHAVKGIVKHVDHDAKKITIKAEDGTEQTIKYTDRTAVRAGKAAARVPADTWLGTKEGANVVVRYTQKAGEKTAVAIKDAAKDTEKAVK